jgi:hypothetical protein
MNLINGYADEDWPSDFISALGSALESSAVSENNDPEVETNNEDAEFDAPFEVVSYQIGAKSVDIPDYFPVKNEGSRWTGAAANLVSKLKPGALVVITDIVVRDPGGRSRTLSGSLSYNLK